MEGSLSTGPGQNGNGIDPWHKSLGPCLELPRFCFRCFPLCFFYLFLSFLSPLLLFIIFRWLFLGRSVILWNP